MSQKHCGSKYNYFLVQNGDFFLPPAGGNTNITVRTSCFILL